MDLKIIRYDTIGSTNTEATDHARRGADEGMCIIAREQTVGKGRYGRNWFSAKDAGLYMSLILRPTLERHLFPLITLVAGIAVHDAIADLGLNPDIKWVNDILIADKKISGILSEAIETDRGVAVIVGIGVNLTAENFPNEIAATATSIFSETQQAVTADQIAVPITRYISQFYDSLMSEDGPTTIIENWQQRSTYFAGKNVRVSVDGSTIEGVTGGLEENGALRVRTPDGSVTIVQAGDVERLRSTDENERELER